MVKESVNKNKIKKLIFGAVDEINLFLPKDQQLKKSISVSLSGPASNLDSLGLTNLIVGIEQKVKDELGMPVSLADELAIFQKKNPFRTIGTLINYIALVLKGRAK